MDLHHWLSFVLAALLMGLLPGPGVANIVGFVIGSGRRTAFAAIGGAVSGSAVAMLLSLAGIGAVLHASPTIYRLLEIAGALYLMILGVLAWRAATGGAIAGTPKAGVAPRTAYMASIAVSATNPKSILFFIGFAPQFVDPSRGYAVQCAVMIATFAAVIAITDSIYALASSGMLSVLRSATAVANIRRASGVLLFAIGAAAMISH